MKQHHVILAGLTAPFLITGGWFAYSNVSDRCSEKQIYELAQSEVLKQLVSPATAVFPDRSEIEFSNTGNACLSNFSGYVDSQNSLGAMLRTEFTAYYYRDRKDGPAMQVIIKR